MDANGRYILDDNHTSVLEPDLIKWANFMEKANRIVKLDIFEEVKVSTVFLGLDHSFNSLHAPILFETMIFNGEHDGWQDRYSTWDEALIGHENACKLVKS